VCFRFFLCGLFALARCFAQGFQLALCIRLTAGRLLELRFHLAARGCFALRLRFETCSEFTLLFGLALRLQLAAASFGLGNGCLFAQTRRLAQSFEFGLCLCLSTGGQCKLRFHLATSFCLASRLRFEALCQDPLGFGFALCFCLATARFGLFLLGKLAAVRGFAQRFQFLLGFGLATSGLLQSRFDLAARGLFPLRFRFEASGEFTLCFGLTLSFNLALASLDFSTRCLLAKARRLAQSSQLDLRFCLATGGQCELCFHFATFFGFASRLGLELRCKLAGFGFGLFPGGDRTETLSLCTGRAFGFFFGQTTGFGFAARYFFALLPLGHFTAGPSGTLGVQLAFASFGGAALLDDFSAGRFIALDPFVLGAKLRVFCLAALGYLALSFGFCAGFELALESCGLFLRRNISLARGFAERFEFLPGLGFAARSLLELRFDFTTSLLLALSFCFEALGQLPLRLGFFASRPFPLGGFNFPLTDGSFETHRGIVGAVSAGGCLCGMRPRFGCSMYRDGWFNEGWLREGWQRIPIRVLGGGFLRLADSGIFVCVAGRICGRLPVRFFVVLLIEWQAVLVDVGLVVRIDRLVELMEIRGVYDDTRRPGAKLLLGLNGRLLGGLYDRRQSRLKPRALATPKQHALAPHPSDLPTTLRGSFIMQLD